MIRSPLSNLPSCRRATIAASILLVVAPVASGSGGGWPQFRGPERDGVSREQGLLDALPPEGPTVLWRASPGSGYSGVAVVGDAAYTMGQTDDGQFLFAFDVASGEERWRYRLAAPYRSSYGDGPRSTPLVDGETVFAIDAHGGLHAVSRSEGRRIWSHALPGFGARIPASGYSSTPLVVGSRLLVESGGADGAYLAFRKEDGERLWSSGSDDAAYASPVELTVDGVRQVVFFSAAGLQAVDPSAGELLWHYPLQSLCPATGVPLNTATPIRAAPDRLLVASGYGEDRGATMLRVRRARDAYSVETVWKRLVLDSRVNSAVFLDGRLFGVHGDRLQAIDASTGRELWSAPGFRHASLIAADGKLIVLGERGRLHLIEASASEFRELGSSQLLEGRSWTSPSLADGRLYLRNGKELLCLDWGADAGEAAGGPIDAQ